jgi:hypothetical protein
MGSALELLISHLAGVRRITGGTSLGFPICGREGRRRRRDSAPLCLTASPPGGRTRAKAPSRPIPRVPH